MSKIAADMMLKAKQEVEGSSPEGAALTPGDRTAEELVAASQGGDVDADTQAGIDEANEVGDSCPEHSIWAVNASSETMLHAAP